MDQTTSLPATHPVYSNKPAFELIEEFLLGRQQQRIARMTESFHPKIEFRGTALTSPTRPIKGITSLTERMQRLLKETSDFDFKIKKLIWDESLSSGAVTIEQQYISQQLKEGYRVWETAMFKIEEGLITHYISTKEVLSSWNV